MLNASFRNSNIQNLLISLPRMRTGHSVVFFLNFSANKAKH